MFSQVYVIRTKLSVEKLMQASEDKVQLGLARADDLFLGALRRASMVDPIHRRSGNLARMWEKAPAPKLSLRYMNRAPYARILEKGGEVKPKTAKALAIPLPGGPAMTTSGVPRYPGGPRTVPEKLFIWKAGTGPMKDRTGKAFLASSEGGKLRLWYVLRRDPVKIPAFRYATIAIEKMKDRAMKEVVRAIQK